MQACSNPDRESDPHALPDIEVFFLTEKEALIELQDMLLDYLPEDTRDLRGWYYQPCFPGCLPDGEPIGPFKTEAEALADAQSEQS